MKTRSETYQLESELQWETPGPGIQRQIMGYDGQLMIVKVKFEKGAVGTMHAHYHSQATYVASGKFELTIGDEKKVLGAGDGYYVAPEKGKPGETMFASTGVVHKLIKLYEEKKFLPFTDEELSDYSQEDIGDVLKLFAEQLADRRADSSRFVIYVNARHRPWFSAWYKNTYGANTDYTGVLDVVPDYNIPIRWVPNMGNLKLIFSTIPGNINLLENVPGEEYKMMFQRDLEEVIAYSYWKEGAGVAFAGVQKETLDDLKAADAMEQMVFMNWPAEALAADATSISISKTSGILFTTGENTKATALTDIVGAKEGVIYRIECGSATNATTIAKSDKFSEIQSAWNPAKAGEFIKVYYRKSEGKFYEAARG